MSVPSSTASRPFQWRTEGGRPRWPVAVAAVALAALAIAAVALVVVQAMNRPATATPPVAALAANTVTVQGEARVQAVPDMLSITIGVSAHRPTVRDAMAVSGAEMTRVTDAIKGAGVPVADISTESLSLGPYWENGQVTGYSATNSVLVQIRDLGKVNNVLVAAADAAGNDVQFSSARFDRADIASQLAQARANAVKAAGDQAGTWSRLTGRQLGKVTAIQEQYGGFVAANQLPSAADGRGGGGGTTVPIEPGQGEVISRVSVVYSLDG